MPVEVNALALVVASRHRGHEGDGLLEAAEGFGQGTRGVGRRRRLLLLLLGLVVGDFAAGSHTIVVEE